MAPSFSMQIHEQRKNVCEFVVNAHSYCVVSDLAEQPLQVLHRHGDLYVALGLGAFAELVVLELLCAVREILDQLEAWLVATQLRLWPWSGPRPSVRQ